MPLVKQEITTTLIDESDLNNFIQEIYGHSYEVAGSEEWDRNTAHLYELEMSPPYPHQEELLEKFIEGKGGTRMIRILLQDMVNEGYLTPGHYTIFTT